MAKISFAVPDAHILWIGRIAEAWSQLEFAIDRAIWHLCDANHELLGCITCNLYSVHPHLKDLPGRLSQRSLLSPCRHAATLAWVWKSRAKQS